MSDLNNPESKPIQGQTYDMIVVSDGTGITADHFAHSLLTQFDITTKDHRFPFVDSMAKGYEVLQKVNNIASKAKVRPLIFMTLVNQDIADIFVKEAKGAIIDLFQSFIVPLEAELGMKSNHFSNRMFHNADTSRYHNRINAINFSLTHDDGQTNKNLQEADVILVGVSRCGKTPTSLYLAMQHGIKAANCPLIPEDFERNQMPSSLKGFESKIYGLTIEPQRLSEIRNERRPGSKYAAIENCRYEVSEAEKMMRRNSISSISTTHKSIEEIATTILQDLQLEDRF